MGALSILETAAKVVYVLGLFGIGGAFLFTAWKFLPPLIAVANRLTEVASTIPDALAEREPQRRAAAETLALTRAIADKLGVKVDP